MGAINWSGLQLQAIAAKYIEAERPWREGPQEGVLNTIDGNGPRKATAALELERSLRSFLRGPRLRDLWPIKANWPDVRGVSLTDIDAEEAHIRMWGPPCTHVVQHMDDGAEGRSGP